jgi:hypothetical protein
MILIKTEQTLVVSPCFVYSSLARLIGYERSGPHGILLPPLLTDGG